MARDKPLDRSPKLIPVDCSRQILPGSCEYALCHVMDPELDLAEFDSRFRNDEGGAPADAPALLLKIVLLAYLRGLVRSRAMERAWRHKVLLMAVSGDATSPFPTLAAFVREGGEAIGRICTQVLLGCDHQGLIGRQRFAIDGVKLPSTAAKARSGTRKEFQRAVKKMDQAVHRMLTRHRQEDLAQAREREARQVERLKPEAEKIRKWLQDPPKERRGIRGGIRKSNRTDHESAKMATGQGVIQGYPGVAAVAEKHPMIVSAQAHGVGQEQELLVSRVEAVQSSRAEAPVLTAEAGYPREANLKQWAEHGSEAYRPDNGYRQRAPRYAGQDKDRSKPAPLYNKGAKPTKPRLFRPQDFQLAEALSQCVGPAGKRRYRNGRHRERKGFEALKFSGRKTACGPCAERERGLRYPDRTPVRQGAICLGPTAGKPETHTARGKRKRDSPLGKEMLPRRLATVEPVCGNLRHNTRLKRFTLRGRTKVDGQGKLYCLVHNIEKLAQLGYAR